MNNCNVFGTIFGGGGVAQYFSYIVAVSFIGGGDRITRRKPPICRKSLINFIHIKNILVWICIVNLLNGMTFIRYALDQTKDYKVCISVLPLTT
jgi:hypothetical protein